MRVALPARFPVCGRALHRHAAKVTRTGVDILAELHHAERHVTRLGANLTPGQRVVFREAIRNAHKNTTRACA